MVPHHYSQNKYKCHWFYTVLLVTSDICNPPPTKKKKKTQNPTYNKMPISKKKKILKLKGKRNLCKLKNFEKKRKQK